MKIKLRKLKIKDLFDFVKVIKNPAVGDRLQYDVPGYFLKGLKEILIRKKTYKFAILVNENFAGAIILEKPNKDKSSYELGYFVAKKYWGKGIATRAVQKIVKFGLKKLKLKKIWAVTDIKNPASGRVLEKAGFKLSKKTKKELTWEKEK